MRVIRTGVHFQFAVHRLPQFRFGQHAVHRVLDELCRLALAHEPRALFAQASFVAAVLPVDLLIFLPTGELHLRRVDDNYVIARIDERRVAGLVLALEKAGGNRRDAAEHPPVGVNDVPAAGCRSLVRTGDERRHS